MRKYATAILLLFFAQHISAQKFVGTWQGKLEISMPLRIVFFITDSAGALHARMQSPDQSKMILPMDTCYVQGDSLFIFAKKFGFSYRGKLAADSSINGIFRQGADMSLNLVKNDVLVSLKRPQTPKPPFPYNSREVTFSNPSQTIQFAGTLTWPKKDSAVDHFREPIYPAVIMITGSGAQDRNEDIFSHQPFAVIADALSRKGFAVLRYDERGVGKSTGKFAGATSADFAADAEAAFDFLKSQPEVDKAHVGIIGHSEGGMIAEMIAARRKDVHHIVLLAGPGVPVTQLMVEQINAVGKASAQDSSVTAASAQIFTLVANEFKKSNDTTLLRKRMNLVMQQWIDGADTALLRKMEMNTPEGRNKVSKEMIDTYISPWFNYFLRFEPAKYLKEIKCNVLALNGSKDIQVLPLSNLAGIKSGLAKNTSRVDIVEVAGLNHLFQTCKICSVAEYGMLEESFSPKALEILTDWLWRYGR